MRTRTNSKPWPSDEELVREILAGSQSHFDMLYSAYFPRVYRFALKRLSDVGEAEDVAGLQRVDYAVVPQAGGCIIGVGLLLELSAGLRIQVGNVLFRGGALEAGAAQFGDHR